MKVIYYDRGGFGYRISIYPPSDKYPMYQVACNDEEYASVKVLCTQAEVKDYVDFILRHADAWEAAS